MDNNNQYGYNYDSNMNYMEQPNSRKTGNGSGFGKGVFTGFIFALFAFLCVLLISYFVDFDDDGDKSSLYANSSDNGSLQSDESSIFTDSQLSKLQKIQALIDMYSYYDQDSDEMMDAIYTSIIASLDDDYAVYYNDESYASLLESTVGTYSGIGCVVTQNMETGQVIVVQPYKGSPAYEAGIAIGDIILKAGDKELTGMDLNEAVTYIKGEEGTYVTVTYMHNGEEFTVDIERRSIEVPTVDYEMLEGDIGYILISDFEQVTVTQFEDALDALMSEGAKGFIFDVRSNPGGLYDAVCSMLDILLPEGTLVYTEDKYGNRETETSDSGCIELPMAVLINGNSASASEIFAGALQDYGWAEIIGTQSFGKGIVQSIIPLGDGTAVKFTIASYFTPNGVCIHGIGITPDEVVELPTDDEAYDDNGFLLEEYDTQLDAAIAYINSKAD